MKSLIESVPHQFSPSPQTELERTHQLGDVVRVDYVGERYDIYYEGVISETPESRADSVTVNKAYKSGQLAVAAAYFIEPTVSVVHDKFEDETYSNAEMPTLIVLQGSKTHTIKPIS